MLRRRSPRRSQRGPQHHRHFPRPAGHVVHLGRLVHHLVHRQRQKIPEHDIHHRPQSRHRGPHSHPRESCFRNRCINHALRAELLHQPRQYFERCSRFRHVLAENAHPRIAPHLFRQRFADRLRKRHLSRGHLRHKRLGPLDPPSDKERQSQTPPPPSSPPALLPGFLSASPHPKTFAPPAIANNS